VNKTIIGAVVGAVAALIWIVIGGWALIGVVILALAGGTIGYGMDRGVLNDVLEKLSNR